MMTVPKTCCEKCKDYDHLAAVLNDKTLDGFPSSHYCKNPIYRVGSLVCCFEELDQQIALAREAGRAQYTGFAAKEARTAALKEVIAYAEAKTEMSDFIAIRILVSFLTTLLEQETNK